MEKAETEGLHAFAAHNIAMQAKELVFKAQDQVDAMPEGKLRDKLRKRLGRVRSELELLDNLVREHIWRQNP